MPVSTKNIVTSYEGRKVKLTNLDKIIYPQARYAKADVIQYFLTVAPDLLAYLKDRPLTTIRFPNGIDKASFYKKEKPDWTPDWIGHYGIKHTDEIIKYIVPNELAVIPWLANLAALELHPMQSRIKDIEKPDFFIYDLDPPEGRDFSHVKDLAFRLKRFLEIEGHQPIVKTSGSKGLHLMCRIKERQPYPTVFEYLKKITKTFIDQNLSTATLQLNKSKRGTKTLIDIYRNHRHNTTVAAFSLRGKPGASISWPVTWKHLEDIDSSVHVTIANYQEHLDEARAIMKPFLNFEKSSPKVARPKSMSKILNDLPSTMPKHMLAGQAKEIPKGDPYFYEIKWDGIRVFIVIKDQDVKIMSRNGRDISHQFKDVQSALLSSDMNHTILDGEIVCLDKNGIPEFAKVISRLHSKSSELNGHYVARNPAIFYCFDAPYLNGKNIKQVILEKRREMIQESLRLNKHVKFSDSFQDGDALYEHGKKAKLEGIMVKNKNSFYAEGKRGNAWIKIKYRERALVEIIGYTAGSGDRVGLPGSFHIVELKEDIKIYRGRVGTGFTGKKLKSLQDLMAPFVVPKKPIPDKVDEERTSVWIDPPVLCEVEYASITNNDTFREPVFLKLIETI